MSIHEIIDELAAIEDWEDRYARLIAIGRELPALDACDKVEANRVHGCASQVWLVVETARDAEGHATLRVRGDSDALIVRGLVSLLARAYSGLGTADGLELDALSLLSRAGLQSHLSPQRANGLASMVQRIREAARCV